MPYINHDLIYANSWFEQRRFIHQWANIGFQDRRWVPPLFYRLRPALYDAHAKRGRLFCIRIDAVRMDKKDAFRGYPGQAMPLAPLIEEVVATAVIQIDPRRTDKTAYFSLFHTINDRATLRILFDSLSELLREVGCFRLLGPFGLSPFLERGVLQTHWDKSHSLYTAYNQPYFPELLAPILRPFMTQHLYHIPLPQRLAAPARPDITIVPLSPHRLATDLLPLLQTACQNQLGCPVPDAQEAQFLHRLLPVRRQMLWGAEIAGQIVGFFLMLPDDSRARQRSRGGKQFWQIGMHQLLQQQKTQQGRLLLGGVLPQFRAQGIGRALVQKALSLGAEQQWAHIVAGPFSAEETAVSFFQATCTIQKQQKYIIYDYSF
jgi:GNAT superfamily N-acetyltransferase